MEGSAQENAAILAAGLLPGFLLVLWWNLIRTGHPLVTPYPADGHGFEAWRLGEGIVGTLLSPGKGLLVYTPALALVAGAFGRTGVLRRDPALAVIVVGSFLVALLRIGGTAGWSGWGGWGIRYYVPWIPLFLLMVTAEWWRRRRDWRGWKICLTAAVGAGALINIAAVLTNWMYRQQLCGHDSWSLTAAHLCSVAALPGNIWRVAGLHAHEIVVPGASAANVFLSNRVGVWWYAAQYFGLSPTISWSIPIVCVCVVTWGTWNVCSGRDAAAK